MIIISQFMQCVSLNSARNYQKFLIKMNFGQIALQIRFINLVIKINKFVRMQASIIQQLKQYFPESLENINPNQPPKNITQYINKLITSDLPHLPLHQIHRICRNQQKNVMNNLIDIKNVDIYQEIANVCPMHTNLRNLTNEEVTTKIHHYSNLIVKDQYQFQTNHYESIVGLEDMECQQNENTPKRSHRQLKNIFQDQDNLMWQDNSMYCLNDHP